MNFVRLLTLTVYWERLRACSSTTSAEAPQHVADWREEVIYQLLVDRFADADQATTTTSI